MTEILRVFGEEVANQIICGTITNTYDYDIVDDCDIRYDVKTKRCTSEPKDKYECSVALTTLSKIVIIMPLLG